MTFIDLEQGSSQINDTFDICIVGAGPAGINIATELIGSGLSVCLVESGGRTYEERSQALYDGNSVGQRVDLAAGRYRIFGGSATKWGGRCAMLDPIDFVARDWVNNSGWPLSYQDFYRYYERAKILSNFNTPWLSVSEVVDTLGIELPKLNKASLEPFVWRVAAPDIRAGLAEKISLGYRAAFDWGKSRGPALFRDPNTTVLIHANLTEMLASEDGSRVVSINVSSVTGKSALISAKVFVLACGGIENARILLNSSARMLARLNQYDNVGRYFNQHPRGKIGVIQTDRAQSLRLQKTFNNFLRPRRIPVQYEVGFVLSEVAQRRFGLLNASAAIYYEVNDELIWKAGKRIRKSIKEKHLYSGMWRDIMRLSIGVPSVGSNIIRRYLLGREVIHKNPEARVEIDLEQEPDRESRIFLSLERDALGMRKVIVDWRISELERKTAMYMGKFVAEFVLENKLGIFLPEAWLNSTDTIDEKHLAGNFHFVGTTRMSKHPEDGVVDENCRVWNTDNLYVAGSSNFTTGGHSNPTLTIVALSARLAAHLSANLSPTNEKGEPLVQIIH